MIILIVLYFSLLLVAADVVTDSSIDSVDEIFDRIYSMQNGMKSSKTHNTILTIGDGESDRLSCRPWLKIMTERQKTDLTGVEVK